MAAIIPTEERNGSHSVTWTWMTLTENDTASAIRNLDMNRACVQVIGSFGSSTVILEGSNDGATWAPLNDVEGAAVSMMAAGLVQVQEIPKYMRPSASGGSDQDVDIYLHLSR